MLMQKGPLAALFALVQDNIVEQLSNLFIRYLPKPLVAGLKTHDGRLLAAVGAFHFDQLHFVFQAMFFDGVLTIFANFAVPTAFFAVAHKNHFFRKTRFAHRYLFA